MAYRRRSYGYRRSYARPYYRTPRRYYGYSRRSSWSYGPRRRRFGAY